MGGRTLPYECHHGNVIDWGDFGPHQNGCPPECFEDGARCPDQPVCEQCDNEAAAVADRLGRQQALSALADQLYDEGFPDDPYLSGRLRMEMERLGYGRSDA